ncbi:MAG: 1-acyl-sn-glycerol-3-phosphate acyltransferase [Acidobacteria bacterium]|jgi:1-acyl-sn-glycerol-3-phosphate acyltransferase|nr:1-acyl-sn-glycerol-3-phosphate acyltransferase [Acidobacteriota bacterium]
MLAVLRGARSLLCLLLVGVLWVALTPLLRLVIVPGSWLLPEKRLSLVSFYMKLISRLTLGLMHLGGARFRREGALPTGSRVTIVANHQGLLDIMQITIMAQPFAPAFVTRTRYQRFVPHVSACIRLLHCPMVNPKRDRVGAVKAIRRAAQELPHGLIIFPEGHRSRDGEVRPFRNVGVEAILRARRVPVYIVVNDGLWKARRFVDTLFRLHLVDAWSGAYGPFEVPEDKAEIPAFVESLREEIIRRLEEHRAADREAAA